MQPSDSLRSHFLLPVHSLLLSIAPPSQVRFEGLGKTRDTWVLNQHVFAANDNDGQDLKVRETTACVCGGARHCMIEGIDGWGGGGH